MRRPQLLLIAVALPLLALLHCGPSALDQTCVADDPDACPAGYSCEATLDGSGATRCLRFCDDDRDCTRHDDFAFGCSLDVSDGRAAGVCRPPAACTDASDCPMVAACGEASCAPYECRHYQGGVVTKCFPAGLCPYLGEPCVADGDCCVGLVCREAQCKAAPEAARDAGDSDGS